MISLISNTGIQFHTVKIILDSNTNEARQRMYFHEWYDSKAKEIKLELAHFFANDNIWVRKKDLANFGYLKDGKPSDEWDVLKREIKEITDAEESCFRMSLTSCNLDLLENKWLPFPFFELNRHDDTVFGPINWCRIKLIPTAASEKNKREYDAVLAFDTRAIYEDGDYRDQDRETPLFANEHDLSKNYALCKNEFMLIDYCSEAFSCEWVNKYILNLIHNTDNISGLSSPRFQYLASYIFLMQYLQKNCDFPVVKLYKDRNVQWSNVDIVIDIGNSRTGAVLFDEGNFTKVEELELQDFSNPVNKYSDPFDMRLAFHKVKFGNFGIVDSKQFNYPSFVRLGKEAQNLIYNSANESSDLDKITTSSSPKRYLWNKNRRTAEWEFIQLAGEKREPLWINGISQQFNNDGTLNFDGTGGRSASYSKSSLMTFAMLEILSQARIQINSFRYRDAMGKADKPRRIGKIIITCPTAMSKEEQITLRKCAEEAAIVLDRFWTGTFTQPFEYKNLVSKVQVIPTVKGLSNKEERTEWTYDEATCSQFVFLYAEITKRYLNNSREYFELYGKHRADLKGYDQKSLTIGTLDIGAGTTDLMICAYQYSTTGQATLKPVPLFWESFYYAGDDLLKEFVRQFVIEGPNGAVRNRLLELGEAKDVPALIFGFFGEDTAGKTFRDRQFRSDFNLQVSLPVALKYLELVQRNTESAEFTYDDVFKTQNQPQENLLAHFERHFGFSAKTLKWKFKAADATAIIVKAFEPLLQKIAGIMYSYGCDFILLAGRPTSLPQLVDLFLKFYPVTPNRLITLNNYRVGRWYPFQDGNGYFRNQKSIVAVGAMIGHIASEQGGLQGFSLDLTVLREKMLPTTEYFGVMNDKTKRFGTPILSPESNSANVPVSALPFKIGCRQLNAESYPTRVFYVLDFNTVKIEARIREKGVTDVNELKIALDKEKKRILNVTPLTATITREDYHSDKETLTLESILDKNHDELPLTYFNLQIQSLSESDNFWLDTGEFILDIQTKF